MADRFLQTLISPPVRSAQLAYYGSSQVPPHTTSPDELGEDERHFIEASDSFYMASVSPDGWPYIQHRGGPAGFLKVLSPKLVAFADFRGNRQLLSTGNIATNDRVALFLMDYPNRTRLKLLGRARILDARENAGRATELAPPALRGRVERVFEIEIEGFDWICPQFITPRYSASQVQSLLTPLQQRIA